MQKKGLTAQPLHAMSINPGKARAHFFPFAHALALHAPRRAHKRARIIIFNRGFRTIDWVLIQSKGTGSHWVGTTTRMP